MTCFLISSQQFVILCWPRNPNPQRTEVLPGYSTHQQIRISIKIPFNLSYDVGGGLMCPPKVFFIFLLKISPPDQTLRPTCKFLILGLLYHDFHSKILATCPLTVESLPVVPNEWWCRCWSWRARRTRWPGRSSASNGWSRPCCCTTRRPVRSIQVQI